MTRATLITGATGYLGGRLARRLLATTDDRLILWLHGTGDELAAKQERLAGELGDHHGRVIFCAGELAADQPFAAVDPRSVGRIVHSAAVTRFNVDADTADTVNVAGADKLFRFARSCPQLEQLVFLSTVYASGLAAGEIAEQPLDSAAGFANHYERSKWAAESLLTGDYGDLPWTIARVATVIADDEGGAVSQYNAVHNTLKLFFYGLISLLPGLRETPLYFVTGDFVTDAVAQLLERPGARSVYHVAHPASDAPTLDDLVSLAFDEFGKDASFRKRRILAPLYTDAESFDMLVDGIDGFGGDVSRQALLSVAPFARQLFVGKDFKNDHLVAEMSGYRAPDPETLVRKTCAFLVQTRWGKESP